MNITKLIQFLEQAKQIHGEAVEVCTLGEWGVEDVTPDIIYTIPTWKTYCSHWVGFAEEPDKNYTVKLIAL